VRGAIGSGSLAAGPPPAPTTLLVAGGALTLALGLDGATLIGLEVTATGALVTAGLFETSEGPIGIGPAFVSVGCAEAEGSVLAVALTLPKVASGPIDAAGSPQAVSDRRDVSDSHLDRGVPFMGGDPSTSDLHQHRPQIWGSRP
jgi:hypothetical protein